MIRAAIAIGSNSTRMLAADLGGSAPRPLLRLREDTKLFMGLDEGGFLSEEAMDRTVLAVSRLKAAALSVGCGEKNIDLYATSATRDAQNRDEFSRRLQASAGLSLYVMSGEEEAGLAFAAVADGTKTLAVDIGGGSAEIILGTERPEASVSLQAGASRLLKACPIAGAEDVLPLTERLRKTVRDGAASILDRSGGARVVLLGGTGTAARDILTSRLPGGVITAESALSLAGELAGLPLEVRRCVPGLPPAKAEHIVHGLCILAAILHETGAKEATASSLTNLDGWMSRLNRKYREGGTACEE